MGQIGRLACMFSHFAMSNLRNHMDCSQPGSSVHGILQARILEWAVMRSSRESSQPEIEPTSPALAGGFFTTSTTCDV